MDNRIPGERDATARGIRSRENQAGERTHASTDELFDLTFDAHKQLHGDARSSHTLWRTRCRGISKEWHRACRLEGAVESRMRSQHARQGLTVG